MSSSCFSTATIVRCPTLSNLQNGVVFIPPAVQIVFLVSLAVVYWRTGRRKHFLVLADGSAFYIVALLDLLSHLVPGNDLDTFKIFDIVIGSLSFVPILLYTTFLFLFSRTYFVPTLSNLPRAVTQYALLALIPFTIAMSELGSFLGISYTILQNSQGDSFLGIGFKARSDHTLWQLFSSITLVLLIILQAFIFLFCVYVATLKIQERRTGRSLFEGFDMPALHGVIWIAVGVKIGAVESLLGFVSGGFSIVLTRRILRLVSRCCLAFGALQSEGAQISQGNGRRRSRTMSQIRAMISNPRASTFVRLSPTAEGFHSMLRAADGELRDADEPIPRRQRVTVHYDGRTPPALNLRLSVLDVPPAEVLTATFNKRGTIIGNPSGQRGRSDTGSTKPSSRSLTRSLSAIAPASAPMADYPGLPAELRQILGSRSYTTDAMGTLSPSIRLNPKFSTVEEQRQSNGTSLDGLFLGGHKRFMSSGSLASDSMSIVNNLASQFPGIPPRRTVSGRRRSYSEYRNTQGHSMTLDDVEEATEKGTIKSQISPSNSIKRKPPPALPAEEKSLPNHPRRLRKSHSGESRASRSSSLRRRAAAPPPIDSAIAGPDPSLAQRVSVSPGSTPATTPYTGRSERTQDYKHASVKSAESSTRAQTPGMTYRSGNSTTDDTDLRTVRDLDGAIDPFEDSETEDDERRPDYRIADLAGAESGLNRIASKVAQYDRQRRQSYRHAPVPSPVKYGSYEPSPNPKERKGKGKADLTDGDWDMVQFPRVNESLGVTISRPRPLSTISSNSSTSLQNATAASAKRVTVAARHAPTVSNASLVPSAAFKHMHTTSTSSAQTRASLTERELMRIKSIGRVATRRTPTPTSSNGSFAARQSMRIDAVDFNGAESADREGSADSPMSTRYRDRPQYESGSSNTMLGVRSALREGWTVDSDGDEDEVVVMPERLRSRSNVGR